MEFTITRGGYIELIQLLKVMGLAGSGADAKLLVEDGLVLLNGQLESRKRAKVKPGDQVECEGKMIHVYGSE